VRIAQGETLGKSLEKMIAPCRFSVGSQAFSVGRLWIFKA
jgi:hypothetical protein